MVQSPSWEANWFATSQEIPRISRNQKVHYRTNKRPPTVSILGQPGPVHIPTSHLLEIHPNIIHSSRPRSLQWSPSLWFPHQEPIHPPALTNTRHRTCGTYFNKTKLRFLRRTVQIELKNARYVSVQNHLSSSLLFKIFTIMNNKIISDSKRI